jgi:hypothetical protein
MVMLVQTLCGLQGVCCNILCQSLLHVTINEAVVIELSQY